jgi:hypothetical protein
MSPHAYKVLSAQLKTPSCRQTARASALQISSVAPKSLEPRQQKKISQKFKLELEPTVARPQSINLHQIVDVRAVGSNRVSSDCLSSHQIAFAAAERAAIYIRARHARRSASERADSKSAGASPTRLIACVAAYDGDRSVTAIDARSSDADDCQSETEQPSNSSHATSLQFRTNK